MVDFPWRFVSLQDCNGEFLHQQLYMSNWETANGTERKCLVNHHQLMVVHESWAMSEMGDSTFLVFFVCFELFFQAIGNVIWTCTKVCTGKS